jgi:lipopolysaccharide/colanic/teichoic acid biosynthesis glycosyltransferase
VDILYVPGPDDFDIPAVPVAQVAGIPLSQAVDAPLIGWQALLKRMEDVVVAGAITLLAAPVIVAVAVLVKLTSPGPIFARQKWVGHKGRSFEALRFRTTYILLSDESGAAQPDRGNRRITTLGGWLRRSCLDELPQLLNVLRGDMSLVGAPPASHGHAGARRVTGAGGANPSSVAAGETRCDRLGTGEQESSAAALRRGGRG